MGVNGHSRLMGCMGCMQGGTWRWLYPSQLFRPYTKLRNFVVIMSENFVLLYVASADEKLFAIATSNVA